jgi:hypothetical protein
MVYNLPTAPVWEQSGESEALLSGPFDGPGVLGFVKEFLEFGDHAVSRLLMGGVIGEIDRFVGIYFEVVEFDARTV